MTVKQFINLSRMIVFQFATENKVKFYDSDWGHTTYNTPISDLYYRLSSKTPYIICKDGTGISVQSHWGAHCTFKGIEHQRGYSYYNTTCNLDIIQAETNTEDLNQYGIDDMKDIEAWVEKHGGIDLDKTIEYIYNQLKK